jgi:hypothetical protein
MNLEGVSRILFVLLEFKQKLNERGPSILQVGEVGKMTEVDLYKAAVEMRHRIVTVSAVSPNTQARV